MSAGDAQGPHAHSGSRVLETMTVAEEYIETNLKYSSARQTDTRIMSENLEASQSDLWQTVSKRVKALNQRICLLLQLFGSTKFGMSNWQALLAPALCIRVTFVTCATKVHRDSSLAASLPLRDCNYSRIVSIFARFSPPTPGVSWTCTCTMNFCSNPNQDLYFKFLNWSLFRGYFLDF